MSYLKNREESWIKEQMKLDRDREKEIVQQLQNAIDAIQTGIDFPMAKRLRLAKQEKWLIRWT